MQEERYVEFVDNLTMKEIKSDYELSSIYEFNTTHIKNYELGRTMFSEFKLVDDSYAIESKTYGKYPDDYLIIDK